MTTLWAENLLSGNWIATTTAASCRNAVQCVSSTLSGSITTLFPVMIAVAVLFGGYYILKQLYHSRF